MEATLTRGVLALTLALTVVGAGTSSAGAGRTTVPLNGTWQIADSVDAEVPPRRFSRTVVVPGLANQSQPGFVDVDRYVSRELISNRIRSGQWPETRRTDGYAEQRRNYFWYRRTFVAPERRAVALLKVLKAQFGLALWLNGTRLGDYPGCFSAALFEATPHIRWQGENVLLIRVGAHPGVLPSDFPTGTDFEKLKWTPGIYDDVSLLLCDNPVVETVQVAPRVTRSEILVETRLRNRGAVPTTSDVIQRVSSWKDGRPLAVSPAERVTLAPGESRAVRQIVALPGARLWTPEDPYLYVVQTTTDGDRVATRFGLRELRFDAATKRAYLNGRPYFLRGSNITLHRFFEDPEAGALPWDETWVRKLLSEIPKRLHWNAFRFCIGPAPDRWLDIADETGLLIQNEFPIWTGAPEWDRGYSRSWNADELIRQYSDWMRDNWNHPSVAVWDANNETRDPLFGERIIPAVRGLDLQDRPWENSYNQPVGPDDPVEDHPYLYSSHLWGSQPPFKVSDLESMSGASITPPLAARAMILNEYGWLWLRRDGQPTELTGKVYEALLGRDSTAEQRFEENAYLLAAKTEFWRAYRNYAAILHFVYLTCSYPGVYTADNFEDVRTLRLRPAFEKYMGEAMQPLGVYLAFHQPTLTAGERRRVRIMLVNDHDRPVSGPLVVTFEAAGGARAAGPRIERPFALGPLGAATIEVELAAPTTLGAFVLSATALPEGGDGPTTSRRRVEIVAARPGA